MRRSTMVWIRSTRTDGDGPLWSGSGLRGPMETVHSGLDQVYEDRWRRSTMVWIRSTRTDETVHYGLDQVYEDR